MLKRVFGLLVTAVLALIFTAAAVSAEEADYNGYIVKMNMADFRLAQSADELSDAKYYGDGYYVVKDYETAAKLSGTAEYIEPNYVLTLHGSYDYTEVMSKNYTVNAVGMDAFWNLGCYGEDVLVGVIDSGCSSHTYLNGAVEEGYNMLAETEEEKRDVTDVIGHGTMVSGLIAARHGGKYTIGSAHHAKVLPVKVFADKTSSDVIGMRDGIMAAVESGCKVINMSFGTTSESITMKNVIKYCEDNGVVVVASTGNKTKVNEVPLIQYPAGYDTVIGVGAVDANGTVASFSYNNESVFVVAPGVDVYSTYYTDNKTGKGKGTSFSAPIVAGIVADMLSMNPDLTPAQVREIIKETAAEKGNAEGEDRNNEYGYGIIDCDAIVSYMLKNEKYFVSPIDTFLTVPELTVWKADSADGYVGIWSGDGNLVDTADSTEDEISVFKAPATDFTQLKFMLWDGFQNIKPLYRPRIIYNLASLG